ncbi:MAG: hypothetical protein KDI36_08965 [Pseudomonadales bacterium]|nr:hypothetical protein [Pseudomonadales bacterium]
MIGADINLDKLLTDIDQQLEVLTAIANDNPILTEQLRLLYEAREALLSMELEVGRLSDMIDDDSDNEHWTIIDRDSLRRQAEDD